LLRVTASYTTIFLDVTYQAFYDGPTDLHDPKYDSTQRIIPFYSYPEGSVSPNLEHDEYSFYIYATSEFEARYRSRVPAIAAIVAGATLILVVAALLGYSWFVGRRDDKITNVAAVFGEIVSSLFPPTIRDLLFSVNDGSEKDATSKEHEPSQETKPVACFFPDTTVLYADVVGFTAWSASRPPELVFVLLETLFGQFDRIAHRLGVYKVETIGDCYVAVTGLPDPQPLHAVIMTEFAMGCMREMKALVATMARKLGDGTKDLSMRFGLHSGPVTAGVLRGERSRLQSFGDTVNTTSHIEHTGLRDRIHVSSATAACLIEAGKESWLVKRAELVQAEGGTRIQTYWISMREDEDCEMIEFQ
jgi:class 3 adenylate cyclase